MANRAGNANNFFQISSTNVDAYDASADADLNTDGIAVKGDWIGIYQQAGTIAGGTSPTWTWSLELSVDGGTTWTIFPDDKESTTQAALPVLDTSDQDNFMFWINPLPNLNCQVRLAGVQGGTFPATTFPLTLKYVTRNTANEAR